MYSLGRQRIGYEEDRLVYTGFDRMVDGLKRRLYPVYIAASLLAACTPFAGTASTPSPEPYRTTTPAITAPATTNGSTPRPLVTPTIMSCTDVPKIPYTIERVSTPPYSVRVIVPSGVENKTVTCAYDGMLIEGDYPFINWTVEAIESTIKKYPEDYKVIRDNIRHIKNDELPIRYQAEFANDSGSRVVLVSNRGAYSYDNVSDTIYYFLRYTGRLLHEAEQLRMRIFENINDVKTLVRKSDEREINYLGKWTSDIPFINAHIQNIRMEIENCEKELIPVCR